MEGVSEDRVNLREFLEEAELVQYHELFRDILKVNKLSQLKYVVTEDLAHIGLSKPEQRRYKKIYTKYFPNPYLSMIKKFLTPHRKNGLYGNSTGPALAVEFQPFSENNVKVPTKHIIPVEDITINKELGMGQFGVVQQGTWTTGNQRLQVAIKCLGSEQMTSNSNEFLKEAAVMHSIEHPNIVRLYGVVLHMDSLMLVTELAPLRSLLECLREVSLRSSFPLPTLSEFAEQICEGMTYLENKRLIHRDLAARNILVFNKDRVKISDFGLSRALGVGKDYYRTNYNVNLKLPVAWCAPECILFLRFTSASDVWAFGVCLWEMFTYGFQPWAGFSGQQILEAIDSPNFARLERPDCCPREYYATMSECWSHDPNDRPKFKDLGVRLRELRPDQVQAIMNSKRPDGPRCNNLLEYTAGQILTVIGKESMTESTMWYGMLPGGACGFFDPSTVRPYVKTPRSSLSNTGSLPRSPGRSSLLRSDVKRHTYTGKRSIQRSMISSPQGEVRHTGHVGLDGAYFGDISFLDPAGCPPRQVVTPYKPSEDLEQMPLINPNSPSHLMGDASLPAYPLLTATTSAEIHGGAGDAKSKNSLKKTSLKPVVAPTTSKGLLNKVKSATLGRSFKNDQATTSNDEIHEYHEISDTDTDSNATDAKTDQTVPPESPSVPKSDGEFSRSLLEEMESMLRNLETTRAHRDRDDQPSTSRHEFEPSRAHTLNKSDKKKTFHTGTMKPMSAHDEKTIATACAMANEITTRSMNDLDAEQKPPNSPNERSRFHFKFPLVSAFHHSSNAEHRDGHGKHERRNFSDEANSVPDIQATLTEESKRAYASLIERPTPSSSLMSQLAAQSHGAIPKTNLACKAVGGPVSYRKPARASPTPCFDNFHPRPSTSKDWHEEVVNELPLPPRATKPKLVDKPRHIRKHPLVMPEDCQPSTSYPRPNIYQNFASCQLEYKHFEISKDKVQYQNLDSTVDVIDGATNQRNPFKKGINNPFEVEVKIETIEDPNDSDDYYKEQPLVKDCSDHVSVEDLLEFADHKPCGPQRGAESDEVRIMCKVLKQQLVTPEECLEALDICAWNVHLAIKVLRVRIASERDPTLDRCAIALSEANGDIVKAAAMIVADK